MGTRLQDENNRILDALNEGMVSAVITLYDKGRINKGLSTRRYNILCLLTDADSLMMSREYAEYWLDWFNIKD